MEWKIRLVIYFVIWLFYSSWSGSAGGKWSWVRKFGLKEQGYRYKGEERI